MKCSNRIVTRYSSKKKLSEWKPLNEVTIRWCTCRGILLHSARIFYVCAMNRRVGLCPKTWAPGSIWMFYKFSRDENVHSHLVWKHKVETFVCVCVSFCTDWPCINTCSCAPPRRTIVSRDVIEGKAIFSSMFYFSITYELKRKITLPSDALMDNYTFVIIRMQRAALTVKTNHVNAFSENLRSA